MISVDTEGVFTLSYTCLLRFFTSRPSLLVLFILYQRDKHLKKATVRAPCLTPASCTTSRLSAVPSCSSTPRSSPQVRALAVPSPVSLCPPSCAFFLIPLSCLVASSLLFQRYDKYSLTLVIVLAI